MTLVCRYLFACLFFLVGSAQVAAAEDAKPTNGKDTRRPAYTTMSIRGRVVWMSEALARRFQIKTVPEAAQRVLALETPDGQLFPLIEDIRGRSFRADKRLRDRDVELFVRRYQGSPAMQAIRVYAFRKDGKYELDYWCEICAIAMFELKECACCQGPIELRWRRVSDQK